MSEQETRKTPAAWMRNLLLGSAALNVFLAGFLFANVLKPDSSGTPEGLTRINLGGLPSDLPPELVEEFENNFQVRRGEIEKKYENLARARLKIGDLVANVDINEEELNKALEEIRGLQVEIQGSIHDSMVDTLVHLDPETRKIFIEGAQGSLERGIWTQRRFDGSRWKVVFEDGEIVIDFEGFKKHPESEDTETAEPEGK